MNNLESLFDLCLLVRTLELTTDSEPDLGQVFEVGVDRFEPLANRFLIFGPPVVSPFKHLPDVRDT